MEDFKMMIKNNELFGDVTFLQQGERILFKANDVLSILGYEKNGWHTTLSRKCKGVAKCKVPHPQNIGKEILINFITEGDVYRLITSSQLAAAEKFEGWIFDDVLPTIRKHGMYATEELINNPDLLIQVATELKKERAEKERLKLTTKKQEQIINELKPKADYTDLILKNTGLVTITQIAKDYGMSGTQMNKKLHELGVQYKQSGQWLLYSSLQNNGYTHSETINITRTGGISDISMITKWSQKGRLFLYDLLKQNYILPLIEQK